MLPLPVLHCPDRDARRRLVWEMKLSGRNTAERNAFQPVCGCQLQTGAVAGSQQRFVPSGHHAVYDRPDRVQHIPAGQVVRLCDFGASGGFLPLLLRHDARTFQPQLHPCGGMDCVVNAPVAGHKAAQHGAVGCVDNRVCGKRGDIPLPEVQPRPDRRQVGELRHPFFRAHGLQVFVLHLQKCRVSRHGRAHVHQRAQQPLPRRDGVRERDAVPVGALPQQTGEQVIQPLVLCHTAPRLSTARAGQTS